MGLDLRLSGLASGFDWKPVVEQLIELERIPQKKLVQEQESNNTKISELGILKSQLETLKSTSEALQNDDIYDARKVVLGEDTADYLTATAEVGTLVGEYQVSIHSLGTNTILTSASLKPNGVGDAIDPNALLNDLPLQTAITAGTFTVESQTYEITSSDLTSLTLDDLLNIVSADPESDGYRVTFEYDSHEDRVVVDGGELNSNKPGALPIIGHPNDTSNFLKVMRLLDGAVVTRIADQDNSRAWATENATINNVPNVPVPPGEQAWLRAGDDEVNTTDPNHSHGLPDSRNYTYANGKLYQRIDDSATNPDFFAGDKLDYIVDDVVYKEGFLYKCIENLPSDEFDPDIDYYDPTDSADNRVTYDSDSDNIPDSYWELVVDPKNHANSGATSPASEWDPAADRGYLTGDVVYKMDGAKKYFYQAVADSPATAVSPPAIHDNVANYTQYATTDRVESPGPGGQFYEAQAAWDTITNHASSTPYSGGALVYDIADNQVYEADAKWDNVGAYVAGTKYSAGDAVYDASDDVYKATAAWSGITDHATATEYDNGDQVYLAPGNDIYEANFTLKANSNIPFSNGAIVFNGGKYYEASQNSPATGWSGATNYTIGDFVLDGTTIWEAQSAGSLPDPSLGPDPAWSDATADVQQLSGGAFWTEITLDVENVVGGGYWTLVDATTANGSLWAAEDTDLTGADGYWANVNGDAINLSDTNYWAEIAYLDSYISHDSSYWASIEPGQGEESPGVPFWTEIGQTGVESLQGDPDGTLGNGDEDAMLNTDSFYWEQFVLPDPPSSAYWEEVSESFITSSQALGSVDVDATLGNANLGAINSTGSFFIGDGAGAVEIAYDINVDTVTDLIERVNASDAKVTMSYDAIGDQFIVQSDLTGNLGITLNESNTWDNVNVGSGNLLEMMGLTAPLDSATYLAHNSGNTYSEGDYVNVSLTNGGATLETYWQATEDISDGTVPGTDEKWEQVILGVGRAQSANLGANAIITINGGSKIFSQSNVFDEDAHGVAGLTINASKATSGEMSFVVERDNAPAKNAIDKFVEEFNDAQQYVNSLVAVTREGDDVTVGRFSGNLEISRLGSQLRKIVFGTNYPHSASSTTNDGTNKTVADLDARNTLSENFDADNDGYRIYVTDETAGSQTDSLGTTHLGDENYQEWQSSDGKWHNFTPTFSAFRINDIGLDFKAGNDEIVFENSALLTQELTDNPNKVKALFSEEMPTAPVFDHNTGNDREYGGLSYFLSEFIENFIESDTGTYKTHVEGLQGQNDRLDEDIDDLERYLEQREETLARSFIRMEEMQSRMNTQLQTLQNSFQKK